MERLVVALVLVALAVTVAVVLDRRRPDQPTQPRGAVPAQVDRHDFAEPDITWLVVVFSSATCDSCRDTVAKAGVLAGPEVAVEEVEVGRSPELHRRYGIDAVPSVVVADVDGVVRWSYVGPPSAADLWAGLASVRDEDEGRG